MPYALPDNPVPDDYIKVCVTIPNRREYIRAFLASYSGLARWTNWEREPTKSGAIAAHHFLVAYNETVDNWTDCLSGEEEVTTIINNNYINCGGCGTGTPLTILCYDQDGNPTVTPQPPVDPTVPNPVGDAWPADPSTDPVPDGFEDWTTFDVESCAAANGIWQAVYTMVVWAEGGIDLVATVAVLVAFMIPGIGTLIVAALGGTAIVSLASALVKIILSEQATDILNECKLWLEESKEELICLIFTNRYDIPNMQLEVIRHWFAWVNTVLVLDDVDQENVRELGKALFPLNLLLAYFFEYQRYIEASAPYDCSLCAGSSPEWGMYKLLNVTDPVTIPAGGAYSGIGWIGGTTWSAVQGGNRLQFTGWVSAGQTTITYEFATATDSAFGAPIDAILSIEGNSIVVPVLATTNPNVGYGGTITIPAGYTGGFEMGNGGKLTSWSWVAS